MAVFDYQASQPDELDFAEGEIIEVLKKNPDDWWVGVIGDRRGLFPSNYVQQMD